MTQQLAPATFYTVWHVTPIKDLVEHMESPMCWCAPTVETHEDRMLVIHHAQDGRELVEQHGVN